jgi:hypothetical protein
VRRHDGGLKERHHGFLRGVLGPHGSEKVKDGLTHADFSVNLNHDGERTNSTLGIFMIWPARWYEMDAKEFDALYVQPAIEQLRSAAGENPTDKCLCADCNSPAGSLAEQVKTHAL